MHLRQEGENTFTKESGHLGCPTMESLILGAHVPEMEKLRVGHSVFVRGRWEEESRLLWESVGL